MIWRRECQSIPIDAKAIFHSDGREPTVRATRVRTHKFRHVRSAMPDRDRSCEQHSGRYHQRGMCARNERVVPSDQRAEQGNTKHAVCLPRLVQYARGDAGSRLLCALPSIWKEVGRPPPRQRQRRPGCYSSPPEGLLNFQSDVASTARHHASRGRSIAPIRGAAEPGRAKCAGCR